MNGLKGWWGGLKNKIKNRNDQGTSPTTSESYAPIESDNPDSVQVKSGSVQGSEQENSGSVQWNSGSGQGTNKETRSDLDPNDSSSRPRLPRNYGHEDLPSLKKTSDKSPTNNPNSKTEEEDDNFSDKGGTLEVINLA